MNHKGYGAVEIIVLLLFLIAAILIFREKLIQFITALIRYQRMGYVWI